MIPMLDNEEGHELVIPRGTQPDEVIRIPGKGMASLRGYRKRGDLYVKIVVQIPKNKPAPEGTIRGFCRDRGFSLI